MPTDTERLDFLEHSHERLSFDGRVWRCRGRDVVLGCDTARAAIDFLMGAEFLPKGGQS